MMKKINIVFLSAIYKYLWEISRANTGRKPSADNSGTSATGRNIVHISSLSLELYNLVLHSWCISIWVWYDSRILHKTARNAQSTPLDSFIHKRQIFGHIACFNLFILITNNWIFLLVIQIRHFCNHWKNSVKSIFTPRVYRHV